jgi:hypothetical protein
MNPKPKKAFLSVDRSILPSIDICGIMLQATGVNMSFEQRSGNEVRAINPGKAFNQHIDRLVEKDDPMVSHPQFLNMCRLFADRLGEDGLVPTGFITALMLYTYDCEKGVNGFDHTAMPVNVTGFPSAFYRLFERATVHLSRDAFGQEFGENVVTIYRQLTEV